MNALIARLEPFIRGLAVDQAFGVENRKGTHHAGRRGIGAVDRAQAAEQTGQGVVGTHLRGNPAIDLITPLQHAHQQRDLAGKVMQQPRHRNTDDRRHFGHRSAGVTLKGKYLQRGIEQFFATLLALGRASLSGDWRTRFRGFVPGHIRLLLEQPRTLTIQAVAGNAIEP